MYELGFAARYRKPLRLLVPSTSGTVCDTNVTLASYLTYMYHLSLGGSFHVGSTQSHILVSATLMRALRSPNTKQVSALTIMNKAKPGAASHEPPPPENHALLALSTWERKHRFLSVCGVVMMRRPAGSL